MKFFKWLDEHLEESILAVLLMIMTVIMGIQVFSRFVLRSSLHWSEELTRYCFVWCGFISIGLCTRHALALRVDQLNLVLPKKASKWFTFCTYVAEFVLFVFLIPNAYKYVAPVLGSARKSPAAQIPIWTVQISAVIGFTLGAIRAAQRAILTAKTPVEEEKKEGAK
jgi:TRAP-type C4-dicarboxylate transport system permease small subunit